MSDRDRAYRILGLEPDATLDGIQEAYQDLKAVWHPDRFSDNPELRRKAEAMQEEVEHAYQLLQDYHTSGNRESEVTGPSVPQNQKRDHGPSILDDTLSARKHTSKRWLAVWLVLFAVVAMGVVISFLTWSPVDVESTLEHSREESVAADMQANRSDTRKPQDESVSHKVETGEFVPEPAAEGTREEIRQGRQQTSAPEKPAKVIAEPPVEPRSESTAQPKVAPSVPQLPAEPTLPPASSQVEESVPSPEKAGEAGNDSEEQAPSELAERAYQMLRAKSELANRLVEGGFTDYGFLSWKAIERSSTEVYVDLLAESFSDGREVHFVWAVDVEAQSVKEMSQAARDLQTREQ